MGGARLVTLTGGGRETAANGAFDTSQLILRIPSKTASLRRAVGAADFLSEYPEEQ